MTALKVVDLFCGGGGASTGLIQAFAAAGVDYELIGINHWQLAVDTNELNHHGIYYRDGVEKVSPRELVPGGIVDFLWASPECTNHSRAKGGRPKDEQSRATAWDVLKWPQELYVKRIYIENVTEFTDWGPCDEKGQPIKSKKGATFRAFLSVLKSLGYRVDYRVMNAADFGAPTSRLRLIIQAVRDGKVVWPEPTHAKNPGLFKEQPWIAASQIIDWSIKGKSIFGRNKPLAPNTLKRIYCGVARYWGSAAYCYLPMIEAEIKRSCDSRGLSAQKYLEGLPAPENSNSAAPFIIVSRGTTASQLSSSSRSTSRPVPTITAGGEHIGLIEPLFVPQHGGGTVKPIGNPLSTITTTGAISVVEPFVIATGHTSGGNRCSKIKDPVSTIVTKAEHCIVEPFAMKFYGNERGGISIQKPLGTITTKDRFGIVSGEQIQDESGNIYKLDILFRMFQPHELAAAMSFPADYRFAGKRKSDIVKQIGNAVPPKLAESLALAALAN